MYIPVSRLCFLDSHQVIHKTFIEKYDFCVSNPVVHNSVLRDLQAVHIFFMCSIS